MTDQPQPSISPLAVKTFSLGAALKPRPAKATMRRIGIVPLPEPAAPPVDPGAPIGADTDKFPPMPGVKSTNVTFHGGITGSGASVQLIFWGDAWNFEPGTTLLNQLMNAAQVVIEGPYFSALRQYGVAGPGFRGAVTIASPAPPAVFDDDDVGDLVWNCIESKQIFAEPDEPGGRNIYCVMMPPGTRYGPSSNVLGAHSAPDDFDPFDISYAWVAWIGHSDLDSMTIVFSHEVAETCTDPEGGGWFADADGDDGEIGDICVTQFGRSKGVAVSSYWAKDTHACVVPQCPELVTAASASPDKIDVFAVGTDSGVYTARWAPDTNWQGWFLLNGGFVAPGTSIFAASSGPGRLDVFVVGLDLRVWTASRASDGALWQGWSPLGTLTVAPGSSVHAVSRGPGLLDIFAVRHDRGICTTGRAEHEDWAPWLQLNGGVAAPGTTVFGVSAAADKLDVFCVGSDFGVYTASRNPGSPSWQGWTRINGGFAAPGTSVYGVSRALGKLDVFNVGLDRGIYTASKAPGDTNWQGWSRIAGGFSAPGTSVYGVSRNTDMLDVFAVGQDHGVYTASLQPGDTHWQGWSRIAGGVAAPGTGIFGVSRSTDKLDVFNIGADHGIYNAMLQPGDPNWQGWHRIQEGLTTWGL